MHLRLQHVIAGAVALASFGLALNQGGYSIGFIAGVTFAVWWAVLLALVLRVRPQPAVPLAAVGAGACLALLAGWTAASAAWAGDDGAVFVEVVRVLSYLGLFTLVLVASGASGARPWLGGLAIGLSAMVVLGLASRFEPSFGDGDLTGARLSYPIGYWNAFAACSAFSLVLLAWHAANGEGRLTRSLATAALPLPALAIFLSGSRGGVGTALVGVLLLLALGPRRWILSAGLALAAVAATPVILYANSQSALLDALSDSTAAAQGHRLLLLCLGTSLAIGLARYRMDPRLMGATVPRPARRLAVGAALIALAVVVVAQNPLDRYESFKQPPGQPRDAAIAAHFTNDNGSGRYQFWEAAIDAFAEHPLRGIGSGQYQAWWNEHGSIFWVLRDAHSLLFETGAELGLVGLGLVMGFFAFTAMAGYGRRAGRHGAAVGALLALLAAAAFSASIDWMWELPAVFAPVVVAAALLTGPATAEPAGERTGRTVEVSGRRRLALGLATGLIGWLALWCAGDLLLTDLKLEQSRSAAASRDFSGAAEAANDAVALQPWAAEPRLQLGLVQEALGDYSGAADTLRGAIDRAPDDWRIWFLLGRVEERSSRLPSARRAYARARALNPNAEFLDFTKEV
jgi:tetratricopeptide (TPR) repeat protein